MTSSSTPTAYCYRMLLKNKLKKALHMVSTCLRFEPKHLLQVQYIVALGRNIRVTEKPIFLSQHQSVLNDTKPLDLFTNLLLIIRFSILYHLSFRSSPQSQITSPPYYSSQSSLSPKTARSTIEKKK